MAIWRWVWGIVGLLAAGAGIAGDRTVEPVQVELLTPAERRWLDAHPGIRLAPTAHYQPIEYFDEQGRFQGITAEYFRILESRLGYSFQVVRLTPEQWQELDPEKRGADVIPASTKTTERQKFWAFTPTFLSLPTYIITRRSVYEDLKLSQLMGSRVAVVQGWAVEEFLRREHPELILDVVADPITGLRKVSFGLADAFISELPVATWWMETEGISNLKMSGQAGFTYDLGISVRSDWPELLSILNKGLASITPEERRRIHDRWVRLDGSAATADRWKRILLWSGGGLLGLLALALVRNRFLALQVREHHAKTQEAQLKEAEQTVRNQNLLLDLSRELWSGEVVNLAQVARNLAESLQVERTSIWAFAPDQTIFTCRTLYLRSNKVFQEGHQLEVGQYPRYYEALSVSRTLAADEAQTDPRTRELAELYLKPFGVTSLLDVGVRSRRGMAGIVCLEHVGNPRRWTAEEQTLAASVADLVALVFESEERRRMESALRESEEKFSKVFQNSPDAISLLTREEGRILDVNHSFCLLLGYAREDVLGRLASELTWICPEDLSAMAAQLKEQGSVRDFETRLKTKAGDSRDALISFDPVEIGGQPCLVGVIRDITDRKRAERALREAHSDLELRVLLRTAELAEAKEMAESADRVKSAFLATMSHELRTPLNSILGFTGIIHQGLVGPLNDEQKKQLGMVMNSARHLLSLINDVLDISKIEAGQVEIQMRPLAIRDVVNRAASMVEPLAVKKQLTLQIEIADDLGEMISDRRRLEQILINLLNNAIKFTERGGIRLHCGRREQNVTFAVIDTGIGIKPEHMDILFKPFRQVETGLTRHHEGTGLGLAICDRLVKLLGGQLRVESVWQEGSTFSFTVPAQPNAKP